MSLLRGDQEFSGRGNVLICSVLYDERDGQVFVTDDQLEMLTTFVGVVTTSASVIVGDHRDLNLLNGVLFTGVRKPDEVAKPAQLAEVVSFDRFKKATQAMGAVFGDGV